MTRSLRGRCAVAGLAAFVVASPLLPAQSRDDVRPLVNRSVSATVASVVDGDTVHVRLDGGREIVVRLDGIDTPERDEPFYVQARNATRVLLFDKRVTVKGTDVDRYDRLVGRVMVGAADASIELVKAGLACRYAVYSRDPAIAAAQADAQRSQRGFWAPTAAKPACAGGGGGGGGGAPAATASSRGPFHGNAESQVYHAPSCENYRCKNCTVVFQTEADAQSAGFRPHADCLRR